MAISRQEIIDFLSANPNMSDADIAKAMTKYGVSTAQMADATGLAESEVATRFLTQQILGQNTTSKWSGEGYGGAEANAKAMAKLLADANITNINQFGKVDKYEPVEVASYTLNGKTIQNPSAGVFYEQIPQYDSEGGIQGYIRRDLSPQEIAQVQPTYQLATPTSFDSDGNAIYTTIDASKVVEKDGQLAGVTGQTFGNKETGEAINQGSGRWQNQGGEDLFSGTGEGKGNTAFRAQFDAQGNPIFYTTKGSSSDAADIMPIIQLALAATGAGGLLGNALLGAGASQIAAGALGNAILGGTTSALAGGDPLKGALLGGAGGALGGYLNTAGGAVLGDASDIAMGMADAGATLTEIETALTNSGFSPSVVADSLKDAANVLTPTATNIPSSVPSLLDTVSVVAPTTAPTLTNLLGAASVIPTTAPTQVTAPVTTPTVEQTITSNRPETVTDVINSIAATVPTTTDVTQVSTTPEQVVTSNKPVTTQEIVNAITATLPSAVTPTVTTPVVEEQVVTSQKPVTTQDVINAITSTIPTAPTVTIPTEPVVTPEQVITAEKPVTNQQIIDAITSVIPSTPTPVIPTAPTVPEQVITNSRPVTNEDIVSTIIANIPTPVTTTPEVSVTAEKPITIQDVINVVTNLVPTTPVVTPPVVTPEQVITAEKPVITEDVINSIVSTIPTTSVVTPEQVITAQKPVTTQDVINSIIASVPTTPVVPEQTIIAQKPITTQDIVNAIVATVPTTTVTTPTVAEQTITAQKPSSITDAVTAATIPLIQPSTPVTPKQVTTGKELSTSDKIRLAQIGIGAAGLLGVGAAAASSSGSGATQYPIVPVPESWTSPLPTSVAPYTPLTPINFGDRNLLTGTQWEKFLSPNYGKVPEPIRYSAPSNMSYSDLMSILGNKQSPTGANLTISDIISGIQNQYGQTPSSTMG